MSLEHIKKFTLSMAAEAKNKHVVLQLVRYDEDRKSDKVYEMYPRAGLLAGQENPPKLATLHAQSLPGCCGVCLLHTFKGVAKEVETLIEYACGAAEKQGYGLIFLTLVEGSALVTTLVNNHHFVDHTFRNGKTGRVISTLSRNLDPQVRVQDTQSE